MVKTIAEVDPSQIHLMDNEYLVLKRSYKNKQEDASFELTDTSFEGKLLVLGVIRKQMKRLEYTGKYLITPEGERYLEYKSKEVQKERSENIKWWITTGIAVVALILAILSLSLDHINQKKIADIETQESIIDTIDTSKRIN